MKDKDSTVVGYAWYAREQWAILKAVVTDPENIEDSYDGWLPHATASFARLKKSGIDIRKVDVDVEELITWCRAKRVPLDGAARSQFAAEKVRQSDRK